MEEFSREIKRMSPLEPRLRPKEVLGLVNVQRPKKSKSKVGTSKPNDVQKGSKKSAEDLDKLIKIEKRLLPFNDHLPNFLYGPIKALKWKKDYTGEIEVSLDIVNILYATKYHLDE
uniref:Uncharacterized protein n=1 Tax=Cucumis melo TaxID=3656 RepID=A0A9I9DGD2_CUCME